MEVVGYLNHADLLLEDENGVAVIGGGHYVLSLGDHVYFKHALDHEPTRISVQISFASSTHQNLHDDEIQMKFEGCRESFKQYIQATTVH
ncbi:MULTISPECIES: hypothetical protein [Acinetobacter]|jgi:hypothetical protein|uniref:hypothetical protein n=1 Tax=Acinetobacter TaxID=469 RepID=UPI0019A4B675|nr:MULTISPECIES: hypothetical protein [Acinetobacter]MBC6675193.1 hypothetical protein [Acinetobacter sp.]MCF7642774.1 hypothetical protein [Acinetobacter johnsonii]MCS3526184.1 hypothetical protein [Acinetobacter johnsonii]MDH1704610.1 hypothetical protein [Acinetobacter johnsonii]MDH1799376.1 hypothetical protein [Acinetobacter johnsonii]